MASSSNSSTGWPFGVRTLDDLAGLPASGIHAVAPTMHSSGISPVGMQFLSRGPTGGRAHVLLDLLYCGLQLRGQVERGRAILGDGDLSNLGR